jgi:DnaJ-class molecular chaperone
MQATDPPPEQPSPTPGTVWVCQGPGDSTETTTVNGVTTQVWHGCPSCHGSH